MGTAFCILLLIFKTRYAAWGLAIALAGIPLYYLALAGRKQTQR
jgi:APA family basic amino acid/polyamine antiporter